MTKPYKHTPRYEDKQDQRLERTSNHYLILSNGIYHTWKDMFDRDDKFQGLRDMVRFIDDTEGFMVEVLNELLNDQDLKGPYKLVYLDDDAVVLFLHSYMVKFLNYRLAK